MCKLETQPEFPQEKKILEESKGVTMYLAGCHLDTWLYLGLNFASGVRTQEQCWNV